MKTDIATIDKVLRINDEPVPEGGDPAARMRKARCWSRKVMWDEFHTDWVGLWPEDVEAVLDELAELRSMFVDKQRGKP